MIRGARRPSCALLLAGALACGRAEAQVTPCMVSGRDSARLWSAPLDRVVMLRSSGASLRTALDLVAARAGVRLSYSSDLLPLDRVACVPQRALPLGTMLTALLQDAAVAPMSSGGTQVVLAPIGARTGMPVAARTATLDRVVVTGSAAGASQRSLPYAIDVLQGRELRGAAAPTLASSLNGSIPGLWIWADAPTTLMTRFGSMRGASSFGVSTPKVFVDGIELANPLLLSRIAADAVERIEVIRGPQGAALYGADAISGVVNVQLRHDGAANGRLEAIVRSSAGTSHSDYAPSGAFLQEHTVSLRAGSAERSAGAVMALNTTGAIVPGGNTVQFSTDAGARLVTSRTIVSTTARLWLVRAAAPVNPVLRGVTQTMPGLGMLAPDSAQAITQYTLGGTVTHAPDAAWTHTLTAGVDGYRLRGLAVDFVPVPSALDSAMRATRGGADKGTLRATSVRRIGIGDATSATLTLNADAALLRDATIAGAVALRVTPSGRLAQPMDAVRWLSTAGIGMQAALQMHETLFLTAGLRGERNDGFTDASRFAVLPSLGASLVRQRGDVTVKARVAYGSGLRPARNPMRETAWRSIGLGGVGTDVLPERQVGVEAGVELFWKRTLALQVTRFDQRASSLIQQVPVEMTSALPGMPDRGRDGSGRDDSRRSGYARPPRYGYALENFGAITNRGWELSLRQSVGALSVAGTLSLVQSRVDRLALQYAGDLRAGDRMLAVPGRTTGLSVTWTPRAWQLQLAGSQVADWINYDRVGLASTFLRGGTLARGLAGDALRTYWMHYDEVTRVRASVSHDLTRSLSLRLIGENLLDRQRGEPDNVTIVPGRTLSVGLGARF